MFVFSPQIPVHAEGGEGSKDDTSISQAPKPLHKPSKRQSTKLLHRLKNRNKTVPVSDDKSLPSVSSFPPSALTNAPLLSAPWVTPGMDLEKEVLPSTPGGRIVRRGSPMLGMRLPKLVQPASSTSDISHSPELPPINSELIILGNPLLIWTSKTAVFRTFIVSPNVSIAR